MREQNNIDAIRYILAISVITCHFNGLFSFDIPVLISNFNRVGCFFALSGFFIYRSLEKSSDVKTFFEKRVRRIFPSYIFIILFFAIGLVLLSNLSLVEYFTSFQWWKYLISNLFYLNFIESCLPGVFDSNPVPFINGSLWTLKIEWILYLSLPLFSYLIYRLKFNHNITIVVIYIVSIIWRIIFGTLYEETGLPIYHILSRQFFGQLCYFYAGVFIYFHFDKFKKYKWYIFAIAVLLLILRDNIYMYDFTIGPVVVASLVLFFLYTGKWGAIFNSNNNNISYDMFLCHYPIMQICAYFGVQQLGQWYAFAIVLGITLLFSCFSWFVIGKRYLYSNKR